MTKKISAYIKKRDILVEQLKSKIEDFIQFGQEFTDNFKNGNSYYLQYGVDVTNNGFRAKPIGFVKVIDPGLRYYRTSIDDENQPYTAIWLDKARYDLICDNIPKSFQDEIEKLPYMAFLQGCDDGSWIKFFASEQDAIDFFKKHKTLDEILNFCDSNHILELIKKDKSYDLNSIPMQQMVEGHIFSYN